MSLFKKIGYTVGGGTLTVALVVSMFTGPAVATEGPSSDAGGVELAVDQLAALKAAGVGFGAEYGESGSIDGAEVDTFISEDPDADSLDAASLGADELNADELDAGGLDADSIDTDASDLPDEDGTEGAAGDDSGEATGEGAPATEAPEDGASEDETSEDGASDGASSEPQPAPSEEPDAEKPSSTDSPASQAPDAATTPEAPASAEPAAEATETPKAPLPNDKAKNNALAPLTNSAPGPLTQKAPTLKQAKKTKIIRKYHSNKKLASYQKITYHNNGRVKRNYFLTYEWNGTSFKKLTDKTYRSSGKIQKQVVKTNYWTWGGKRKALNVSTNTYNTKGVRTKNVTTKLFKTHRTNSIQTNTYSKGKRTKYVRTTYQDRNHPLTKSKTRGDLKDKREYTILKNGKAKLTKRWSFYYEKLVTPAAYKKVTLTQKRNKIVKEARTHLHKGYRTGNGRGWGPNYFDCSGFTRWVYKDALNVDLPFSAADQAKRGKTISIKTAAARNKLRPGDLLFVNSKARGGIYHVAIYIGKNSKGQHQYIDSNTGVKGFKNGVKIRTWKIGAPGTPTSAKRLI